MASDGEYFLIELPVEGHATQYYCAPGEWCTLASHAQRFYTWEAAVMEKEAMTKHAGHSAPLLQVTGHSWG